MSDAVHPTDCRGPQHGGYCQAFVPVHRHRGILDAGLPGSPCAIAAHAAAAFLGIYSHDRAMHPGNMPYVLRGMGVPKTEPLSTAHGLCMHRGLNAKRLHPHAERSCPHPCTAIPGMCTRARQLCMQGLHGCMKANVLRHAVGGISRCHGQLGSGRYVRHLTPVMSTVVVSHNATAWQARGTAAPAVTLVGCSSGSSDGISGIRGSNSGGCAMAQAFTTTIIRQLL